jgi:hypothetical protein
MKKLACLILCAALFSSFHIENDWKPLLDKKLTNWEIYQSYRLKPGYKGEVPKDEKGVDIKPIGYNKNEAQVFTVSEENGEPVLRISGEIYGCVFTRQDFKNYHLKLKMKWGTKKWDPRLNEPMDSGILYNSQGECGVDYWHSWMLSQEFQIMEHSLGDFWSIANSCVTVKASPVTGTDGLRYDSTAKAVSIGSGTGHPGYCQAGGDYEKPMGEWNTVELICFGDKSVYIVNGKVAMALSGLGYNENGVTKPLTHGKIQLQSEAAEVFYKDILIRDLDEMPKEFAELFK